jgi:hypothetical protein
VVVIRVSAHLFDEASERHEIKGPYVNLDSREAIANTIQNGGNFGEGI